MTVVLCILAFFLLLFGIFNHILVLKGGYYLLALIFNPVTIIIGCFLMVVNK